MAQRYIYLSDELNNLLKKENNASGLIQNLLIDHYSAKIPKYEALAKTKAILEEQAEEIIVKKEIISKEIEKEQEIQIQTEQDKEKEKLRSEKLKKINNYMMTLTEQDRQEAKQGVIDGKYKGIIDYVCEKLGYSL